MFLVRTNVYVQKDTKDAIVLSILMTVPRSLVKMVELVLMKSVTTTAYVLMVLRVNIVKRISTNASASLVRMEPLAISMSIRILVPVL